MSIKYLQGDDIDYYVFRISILLATTLFFCQSSQGQKVFSTTIPDKDYTQNITRTPDGFYWFGNSSGLYRFDGQESTRFIINDPSCSIDHDQFVSSEIFVDARNQYWFSTYHALHSLDPLKYTFSTFRVHLDGQEVETGYNVFYFDQEREEILLKADSSIFAFDTRTYTHRLLLEHNYANEIYPLQEGRELKFYGAPWWNAEGIECFEYKSGAITGYKHLELPVMVKHLAPNTHDSIFLATPLGMQLLKKSASSEDWNLETILPGISRNIVLSQDRKSIYVSMENQGIYEYGLQSNQIVHSWDSSSGLRTNDARGLTQDESSNIFVSHLTDGVDIITANDTRISFSHLIDSSEIADIGPLLNGDILCLSKQGAVYRKERGNPMILKEEEEVPGLTKGIIGISPTGEVLGHGMSSMVTFSSRGIIKHNQSTDTSIFHGVLAFKSDEKLVLSNEGIITITDKSSSEFFSATPNGIENFFSYLIKLSEDRFLASYRQVEIWDFKRRGNQWSILQKVSMPGETQTAILYGESLLLGTSAGLYQLDQETLSAIFNPVLHGNLWVNALHQDPAGRLWLGTEQGLFCYFPETGEYLFFSEADGLQDDWFIRANVISDSISFTMATKTGLVTVDTRLADSKQSDNKIYLSDIWINGIRKTDHSIYAPEPLDLDFQHNAISFQPGMIELSSSALSGFRYQLEGLEEDYTYSKAGEVVRYPSIPPGEYTFKFMGVDKNGRNTEAFTLPITISPPFYQTWWFWTICGTGLCALFYSLNRRAVHRETARQQAIQKEEARKADETLKRHQAVVSEQRRIMMELHDDLGGTLGSLFYTLDGYLLDKESGLPVQPDFELLKNTSGDALKQLREVMKNNIARELPLPVFIRTLTEQARMMASSSRLNWKLEKDDLFPELQLSSRQVHNALLIVKEALQNIRKHAQASSFVLKMHLRKPDEMLYITLTDDGTGMEEQTALHQREDGTGNGLVNMRRRAEDLGGDLHLSTPPSGGTSLQLSFPLK